MQHELPSNLLSSRLETGDLGKVTALEASCGSSYSKPPSCILWVRADYLKAASHSCWALVVACRPCAAPLVSKKSKALVSRCDVKIGSS